MNKMNLDAVLRLQTALQAHNNNVMNGFNSMKESKLMLADLLTELGMESKAETFAACSRKNQFYSLCEDLCDLLQDRLEVLRAERIKKREQRNQAIDEKISTLEVNHIVRFKGDDTEFKVVGICPEKREVELEVVFEGEDLAYTVGDTTSVFKSKVLDLEFANLVPVEEAVEPVEAVSIEADQLNACDEISLSDATESLETCNKPVCITVSNDLGIWITYSVMNGHIYNCKSNSGMALLNFESLTALRDFVTTPKRNLHDQITVPAFKGIPSWLCSVSINLDMLNTFSIVAVERGV